MKRLDSNATMLSAWVAAAALSGLALARVPEYMSDGLTPERWVVPTNGVPWIMSMDTATNQNRVAPGFPGFLCTLTLPGGGPPMTSDYPGAHSIKEAMKVWQKATLDPQLGANLPAHTFRFATAPSAIQVQDSTNPNARLLNAGTPQADGLNAFTLLEPPSSFTFFGSSLALGFTAIRVILNPLNPNYGRIIESDIAVNTRARVVVSGQPPQPIYNFIEDNAPLNTQYATAATPSLLGEIDLRGVLVHEIGHFVGLGHSLVEGEWNGSQSTSPTMFVPAEFGTFNGPFVSTTGAASCALGSPRGGPGMPIQGRSARDLTQDDLSAIGELYPSVPFTNLTATVTGNIAGGCSGARAGVHVTVFRKDDPANLRVGALTRGTSGFFQVSGLPPGDYYALAETNDTAQIVDAFNPPLLRRHYFSAPLMPNWGGFAPGSQPLFANPELYGIDELVGPSGMQYRCEGDYPNPTVGNYSVTRSSLIATAAGATTNIALLVGSGGEPGLPMPGSFVMRCFCGTAGTNINLTLPLTVVRRDFQPFFRGSFRGESAFRTPTPFIGGARDNLEFRVAAPDAVQALSDPLSTSTWSGVQVTLRVATAFKSTLSSTNQLEMIDPAGAAMYQTNFNSDGIATFTLNGFMAGSSNINYLVQAEVAPVAGTAYPQIFTNVVNVRVYP